jgi:protein-tyrosine phosphatase
MISSARQIIPLLSIISLLLFTCSKFSPTTPVFESQKELKVACINPNQCVGHSIITDARVERLSTTELLISWKKRSPNTTVSIYTGATPWTIDMMNPLIVTSDTSYQFSIVDQLIRNYFIVKSSHTAGLMTAERRIPRQRNFDLLNLRDIGGYKTINDKHVKWGRFFRSDALSNLTSDDISFLNNCGVKHIIDFRNTLERTQKPDILSSSWTYEVMQLISDDMNQQFDFVGSYRANPDTFKIFMQNFYYSIIDDYAASLGNIIKRVCEYSQQTVPETVIGHCTGGKDRTGVATALLLIALGVPEKTVVEDFALSSEFLAPMAQYYYNMLYTYYGIPQEAIEPLFEAPPYLMENTLAYLKNNYGSIHRYLRSYAHVDCHALDQLRNSLLE